MNSERNPFYWSIPAGSWFGVQLRISIWFFLVGLAVCSQLHDIPLGLTFTGILFLSVLFHEFGHVLGARATGGGADEIHITPIGGLAMCMPANSFASRFWTVAGGPSVNLLLCATTFVAVLNSPHGVRWWDPTTLPTIPLTGRPMGDVLPDLLFLIFKANWLLLLINLLPVHPLDGGRLLQLVLAVRLDAYVARAIYLRVGAFFGVAFLVWGMIVDNTWIMAVGAVVLPLNLYEEFRMHMGEQENESFMGYDFSEGYTSLERSASTGESSPGLLERWRQQRESERVRRVEEEEREMERMLDVLLEKLHVQGEGSLTPAEKRQLQQISDRFRNRNRET